MSGKYRHGVRWRNIGTNRQELFEAVNKRRRAEMLPVMDKGSFVLALSTLEYKGKIKIDGDDIRPRVNFNEIMEVNTDEHSDSG